MFSNNHTDEDFGHPAPTALNEEEIQQKLDRHGIDGIPAKLSLSMKSDNYIYFDSLENLFNFAKKVSSPTVIYEVIRIPAGDLVDLESDTKELSRHLSIGAESVADLFSSQIDEYIEMEGKRDDSIPIYTTIATFYQGMMFVWRGFSEFPSLADYIIEYCLNNETEISRKVEEKIHKTETAKTNALEQIREMIFHDSEFAKCTNQQLRHRYVTQHYNSNPLWKTAFTSQFDANGFIEIFWRDEMKPHLKI